MSEKLPEGRGRGRGAQLLEALRRRQAAAAAAGSSAPGPSSGPDAAAAAPPAAAAAAAAAPQEVTPQDEGDFSGAPSAEMSRLELDPKLAAAKAALRPPVLRYGSAGRALTVGTNFVRLEREDGFGFFEYSASFSPPVDTRDTRFRLLNQHREMFPVKSFDGAKLLLPRKVDDAQLKSVDEEGNEVRRRLLWYR